jgi:DNA-binding GntR family transcriptional regulator
VIDHDSPVLVSKQVAEWITARIQRPGQRLPSETEIERELHVARGTVRRAYRDLAERGLVVIVNGKGAYAADAVPGEQPG